VSHVKYFGVIFDKRITWRLHIEITDAKSFRTFIKIYSLLKRERLNANIKPTLHKALISSVAAVTYSLKLQRPQNKVLRIIAKFPRCTPVRDSHTAFNLPYVYDYITKSWTRQVIQNHENGHVRGRGQGEARHRKYKRLKLYLVKFTTAQVTKLPL
jgi:hypothetical protein